MTVAPAPALDPGTDPFADGHEDRTPPEVYAVRPDGGGPDSPGWKVRVVPNLYPALSADAVANLIANLQKTGFFKNVEIKETFQDEAIKDMQAFQFTLTCEKGKS